MKGYIKLKDIDELVDVYKVLSEHGTVPDISQIFLKYDNTLTKLSKIVDIFLFTDYRNCNLKKVLKTVLYENNITSIDLMNGAHICLNNIVLDADNISSNHKLFSDENNKYQYGDQSIYFLYALVFKLFCYVRGLIFPAFKYNSKDTNSFFNKNSFDIKESVNNLNKTIYNFILYVAVSKTEPGMYSKYVKKQVILDLGDLGLYQSYIDSELVNFYLNNLLPKEYKFYTSNMSVQTDGLLGTLAQDLQGESLKFVTKDYIELLRDRDFIIPYNGISIYTPLDKFRLEYEEEGFNIYCLSGGINLDVYERQYNSCNYIIAIDVTRDIFNCIIINVTNGLSYTTSPYMYEILNRLLYMYNLRDSISDNFNLYGEVPLTNDKFCSVAFCNGVNDNLADYDVVLPYYWRYRDNKYSKPNEVLQKHYIGTDKTVFVGAFKRKIGGGGEASKEAKDLAKLYCINLEDGETMVRPHERHYHEQSSDSKMNLF